VDFAELVQALTELEGRTARVQIGTPGHETIALETNGPIHAEDAGDGWAVFTLADALVRINLSAGEFTEAERSLDGSGSLRFLTSGVEFFVVPANRR
jgi:hypothetical protein